MTTLNKQVESKRNAVKGTLNQAKGMARERLGQVTDNPKMQIAGKKDQVIGTLQKTVGDSWVYRHKNIVLAATLVTALAAAVVYIASRANSENQTDQEYTYYQS